MSLYVYGPRGITQRKGGSIVGFLSDNKTKKQRKREKQQRGEGWGSLLTNLERNALKVLKAVKKKKGGNKFNKYQRGKKGGNKFNKYQRGKKGGWWQNKKSVTGNHMLDGFIDHLPLDPVRKYLKIKKFKKEKWDKW